MTREQRERVQIMQGVALILLGVFYVIGGLYFRSSDSRQVECMRAIAEERTGASAARAKANELESAANRRVILAVLTADTRAGVRQAYRTYRLQLRPIDQIRDANPVRPFPSGACQ